MTCMGAQRILKFSQMGPPTAELHALERLKNPHRLIMGKTVLPLSSAFLDQIHFILAGNDDIHESSDEFEIWPDLGLLSLHVYTATFRVAAIHVYKIGLPFKLVLA